MSLWIRVTGRPCPSPWPNLLADQHFPGAVQIVDLYPARQHLWDLSARVFAGDDGGRKRWLARTLEQLEQGTIEAIVNNLRDFRLASADLAKLVTNEAEYFERNAARKRHPSFTSHCLLVGSGVIEAACKTVIGARLKRSGMFGNSSGGPEQQKQKTSRMFNLAGPLMRDLAV